MNASTCISCLPREILVKILSGLPAKSAVRFRCCSKFLYSYIPEPRFAFRILLLLPCSSTWRTFLSVYSVTYREEEEEESRHGRLLLQADSAQRLDLQDAGLVWSPRSSSADGKMCLVIDETGADALLDLSTGRCIFLPPDDDDQRGAAATYLTFSVSGSERYKVFKSAAYYDNDRGRVYNRRWVLAPGVDKSWREIESAIPEYLDVAVHIHGIIYYIPYYITTESKIVAMDVATESFIKFIPFPSEYQSPHRERGWVPWIKLNARLAFINFIIREDDPAESKIEIWRLDRAMEEWEKQTILLPLEESKVIGEATSMGFATNSMGEIVFLLQSDTMLSPLILVYSSGRDVWKRFEISGVSDYSLFYQLGLKGVVHVEDEFVSF